MKSIFLTFSLLIIGLPADDNISVDLEKISKAVHDFSSSADQRDIKNMDKILHKDYRAVVNRLFGSEEVSVMNKSLYLDLLKQEKIGGDSRSVEIQSIDVEENNAVVRATFTGKELIFTTFIQLVKDVEGNWLIISDLPRIEKKVK